MRDRWLEAARQGEVQRAIVETVPLPTILHDHEVILYANPAAIELVGLHGPDEIVGRDVFDFVHPEGEAGARERVRLVYERGLTLQRAACKVQTAEGTGIDAVVTGYPVHILGRDLIVAVVIPVGR